jgi:hypothetical protein
LTRQLLCSGLVSIGRADYADKMGEYFSSFFSLSIGLERLAKLIICFDEQQKTGSFPNRKELKGFGHKVAELLGHVEVVAGARQAATEYTGHSHSISKAIISQLDSFADAGRGRYANFDIMRQPDNAEHEPLSAWMAAVGEPILNSHCRGTRDEDTARLNADLMEGLLGDVTHVRHTSENGTPLSTISAASFRTAENEVMQTYGRLYSFYVIRWLSDIFHQLTSTRGYEEGGELWFGHYEHCSTFLVSDSDAKRRKTWPLY